MPDYEATRVAIRAKTECLRAARLAKEVGDSAPQKRNDAYGPEKICGVGLIRFMLDRPSRPHLPRVLSEHSSILAYLP